MATDRSESEAGRYPTGAGGVVEPGAPGGGDAGARGQPSTRGYWLGAVLAVAAVVAAVAVGVAGFLAMGRAVEDFQRVPVPGDGRLTFSGTGGYTVYYEDAGVSEGGGIPAFSVSLLSDPDGEAVTLTDYDSSFTYDVGGHEGSAVLTFEIDRPGAFILSTFDESEGGGTVAVGRGLAGMLGGAFALAGALGITGVGLGAVIVVATAVRRRRWAQQAGTGYGP